MGIFENFKDLLKIADAANNHELYKNLAELQTSVAGLQEENRQLKDKVAHLNEQLSLKEKMHFTAPFYYQEGDKTPFCAVCFEKKPPMAIHVVFGHDTDWETRWDCPACKQMYLIKKGDPSPASNDASASLGDQGWMQR